MNVDGIEVSDPGSHTFYGGSKDASAIEVPEAGVTYYLPQDVPHGQVREVWYHSSVTGSWRHAMVYLPPNFTIPRRRCVTRCCIFNAGNAGEAE